MLMPPALRATISLSLDRRKKVRRTVIIIDMGITNSRKCGIEYISSNRTSNRLIL